MERRPVSPGVLEVPPHTRGSCSTCDRWGHYQRDCPHSPVPAHHHLSQQRSTPMFISSRSSTASTCPPSDDFPVPDSDSHASMYSSVQSAESSHAMRTDTPQALVSDAAAAAAAMAHVASTVSAGSARNDMLEKQCLRFKNEQLVQQIASLRAEGERAKAELVDKGNQLTQYFELMGERERWERRQREVEAHLTARIKAAEEAEREKMREIAEHKRVLDRREELVNGMQAALEETEERLKEEATALQHRESELSQREAVLRQAEEENNSRAQQMIELNEKLAADMRRIAEREKQLIAEEARWKEQQHARETQLKSFKLKEAEIEERKEELAEREDHYRWCCNELEDNKKKVEEQVDLLKLRQKEFAASCISEEGRLDEMRRDLEAQRRQLERTKVELDDAQCLIEFARVRQEEEAERRRIHLEKLCEAAEREAGERRAAMAKQEESLREREALLIEERRALQPALLECEAKEKRLAAEHKALAAQRNDLAKEQEALKQMVGDCEKEEKRLSERERELDQAVAAFSEDKERCKAEIIALEQWHAENKELGVALEKRQAELDELQATLDKERAELEAQREATALRAVVLEGHSFAPSPLHPYSASPTKAVVLEGRSFATLPLRPYSNSTPKVELKGLSFAPLPLYPRSDSPTPPMPTPASSAARCDLPSGIIVSSYHVPESPSNPTTIAVPFPSHPDHSLLTLPTSCGGRGPVYDYDEGGYHPKSPILLGSAPHPQLTAEFSEHVRRLEQWEGELQEKQAMLQKEVFEVQGKAEELQLKKEELEKREVEIEGRVKALQERAAGLTAKEEEMKLREERAVEAEAARVREERVRGEEERVRGDRPMSEGDFRAALQEREAALHQAVLQQRESVLRLSALEHRLEDSQDELRDALAAHGTAMRDVAVERERGDVLEHQLAEVKSRLAEAEQQLAGKEETIAELNKTIREAVVHAAQVKACQEEAESDDLAIFLNQWEGDLDQRSRELVESTRVQEQQLSEREGKLVARERMLLLQEKQHNEAVKAERIRLEEWEHRLRQWEIQRQYREEECGSLENAVSDLTNENAALRIRVEACQMELLDIKTQNTCSQTSSALDLSLTHLHDCATPEKYSPKKEDQEAFDAVSTESTLTTSGYTPHLQSQPEERAPPPSAASRSLQFDASQVQRARTSSTIVTSEGSEDGDTVPQNSFRIEELVSPFEGQTFLGFAKAGAVPPTDELVQQLVKEIEDRDEYIREILQLKHEQDKEIERLRRSMAERKSENVRLEALLRRAEEYCKEITFAADKRVDDAITRVNDIQLNQAFEQKNLAKNCQLDRTWEMELAEREAEIDVRENCLNVARMHVIPFVPATNSKEVKVKKWRPLLARRRASINGLEPSKLELNTYCGSMELEFHGMQSLVKKLEIERDAARRDLALVHKMERKGVEATVLLRKTVHILQALMMRLLIHRAYNKLQMNVSHRRFERHARSSSQRDILMRYYAKLQKYVANRVGIRKRVMSLARRNDIALMQQVWVMWCKDTMCKKVFRAANQLARKVSVNSIHTLTLHVRRELMQTYFRKLVGMVNASRKTRRGSAALHSVSLACMKEHLRLRFRTWLAMLREARKRRKRLYLERCLGQLEKIRTSTRSSQQASSSVSQAASVEEFYHPIGDDEI